MLERVGPGTLVIVPGDREDVILTLTTAHLGDGRRAAEAARIEVADEADDRAPPTSTATKAPRSGWS